MEVETVKGLGRLKYCKILKYVEMTKNHKMEKRRNIDLMEIDGCVNVRGGKVRGS